ncbi:MAG: hypothetical protein CVU79_08570 [Elusimicrobia bacterium HGW-Elusimicrobia-3]|jgi:uncharacterized protein (DUF2267 family)|nr:MAG: hypothetical protein CVU79_08570 [Elusimicrobia bacterium HGW-Elusimicrobia-3]
MNQNNRVTTLARHAYTQVYADYLRSGNLEEATRQVAQLIYTHRGNKPGTPQGDWQEAERITREWPHTVTESSQAHLFDKALAKTRQWLKEIEEELGMTNPNDAYRALRAVLHTVRDRLPVKECAEFSAQLPMMVIGLYYSGWTPVGKPEKLRSMDEFLGKVGEQLPSGMDPLRVTRGIIRVLERHVAPGELKDVRRNFPEKLREVWEETAKTR